MKNWIRVKSFLRRAVLTAFAAVDARIPRGGGSVIFTFPDVEDQGLAVARELNRLGLPVTYLVSTRGQRSSQARRLVPQGVRIAGLLAPRGVWAYLRASRVFHTHGMFGNPPPPPGKAIVNLWHGMPVKRIRSDIGGEGIPATCTPATSALFVPELASAFGVREDRVWVTGLPRNDRLLRAAAHVAAGGSPPTVLWLPTYRASHLPHIAADGRVTDSPVHLQGVGPEILDSLFGRLGAKCTIKMHPMADRHPAYRSENLTLVNDRELLAEGRTLYELLATADLLITDVSSVWLDFLLVDKPIIFCMADRDEYADSRGFYQTERLMDEAGPRVDDLSGVDFWVSRFTSGVDPYAEGRRRVRDIVHDHPDDGSARRLLERLADNGDGGLAQALQSARGR